MSGGTSQGGTPDTMDTGIYFLAIYKGPRIFIAECLNGKGSDWVHLGDPYR